jgi:hypothetical protein
MPEGRERNAMGWTVCDGLGFEEICLAALERVRLDGPNPRGAGAGGDQTHMTLTYHVARPALSPEKGWVAPEGVAQVDQERSTTFKADHWVVGTYLYDLCCLLRGYLLEPLCFQ